MFRHRGQQRNFRQNIRLAVLLCLTAGFVNASGFLGFFVLTTNITGHAALLAVKLTEGDLRAVRMVALWLVLFLSGAFCSSLYLAKTGGYTLPILVEIIILCMVGYFGHTFDKSVVKTEYFAGSLLFAMGMQNALVSVISGSAVRTTHLTGMFTDLGIDLAAAYMGYPRVRKKILLRLTIILFFLLGGIIGGFAFIKLHYHCFYIAVGILVVAMCYDFFRVNLMLLKKRLLTHYP